ncbi:MAG: sulfate reduction electron transfer complex DsrMKJOP subunit DsrM [Desulfovibrionaceae bacterium]|nr:sulfate reduction electron transfer complex DsrMKJOP subunit DsrM [Desulfovibrionaceae bacterium]MDD4952199.1 sulfate reduction electron transfer complex DsrMKJOP subunit DsrM [Desulfovibrionaceae bacterium]
MNALYSLVFVLTLVLIPLVGVGAADLKTIFGVCIPSTAIIVFVAGFVYKIIKWSRSAVPFRIPTTGGQQRPYDPTMFKQNKWDNPSTGPQTVIRMLLEVLAFRSLFRNTKASLHEGPVVAYASAKWLWLFALLFHYSFFIIVARHLRLFMEPIPGFVNALDFVDGILQIGAPVVYQSDAIIILGLGYLLGRRLWDARIRYISLVNDYFPLFLIIGIVLSGVYMRYFAKVDVMAIKELTMGLVTFHPHVPANIDITFFIHLFLVSVLLLYFPFSKLMHLGGVFLSPTRNLPNDTRMNRHINPWNDPKVHARPYADYEDEFREKMVNVGIPVDKPLPSAPAGAEAPEKA